MNKHQDYAQQTRKDTLENVEVSWETKKQQAIKKKKEKDNEFECTDEGFSCVSNIIIMEATKKPKKKRRR